MPTDIIIDGITIRPAAGLEHYLFLRGNKLVAESMTTHGLTLLDMGEGADIVEVEEKRSLAEWRLAFMRRAVEMIKEAPRGH